MLKKIVIGFGLLVFIAVAVIYGKYFLYKAVNDRASVKNVNEQHAPPRLMLTGSFNRAFPVSSNSEFSATRLRSRKRTPATSNRWALVSRP